MDPQSSPGRLTCHPLLYGLQRQTCEQHLSLETPGGKQREREEKGGERKAFIRLWNKQKSQHSAVASPWVKQRLHDWILMKPHQAALTHSKPPMNFRVLAPIPDLAFHQDQQCSSVSQTHSSKHLRRTASEPIRKLKPKRSMNSRKNHLCRKSSAPSPGKPSSHDTYDSWSSSSSTPVSRRSSPSNLSDSGAQFCDYNTGLSHESKRNMSSLRWGNVCMSSSPAIYALPRQEVGAGASSSTLLSVNILNHPVILPMTMLPTAPSPHLPVHVGAEQHKLQCRTRSLQLCQGYRENCSKRPQKASHIHEQLTRTRSFPLFKQQITHHASVITNSQRTGLVCTSQILKQQGTCTELSSPPGHAGKIQSLWSRLQECGLRNQCQWVPGRQATLEELQVVRPESLIHPYGTNPLSRLHLAGTRMAAGSVTELALRVAQGELRNGFAIVKPHGHDASLSSNTKPISVAIAAKQLQCRLNVRKILIVDWDIHHGNITQEVFYTDPRVLYISLHRHGFGNSHRGGPTEVSPKEPSLLGKVIHKHGMLLFKKDRECLWGEGRLVGSGQGEGYNVNVAWSAELDCPLGDKEYLTAFRTVVMPIAQEFSPDVVLVSSEFNAVEGHPASLGGHGVSAKCFGLLTRQLMEVAQDHVVLALEGSHDIREIWDASEACINALLDNEVAPLSEDSVMNMTCANTMQSLQKVLQIQSKYWCSVRAVVNTLAQSTCSAATEATLALASLSMAGPKST
ncbi:hypothetical protein P4O66_009662, partial [Electrophorus voltai]